MKKLIPILFISLLFCGCATSDDGKILSQSMRSSTESEQTQTEEPDETPVESETPAPSPTPVPLIKNVELPVMVSDNGKFLSATKEEAVFYVEFDPERGNNLQLDRPSMPTYTWYLNGTEADTVGEVVIEFDILETVPSLHGGYFGYDRAFFVTLHHFETIPLRAPWPGEDVTSDMLARGDTDQSKMIIIHELGVDLNKYVEWDGNHVRIAIPYSEFQNAPKDLTLQFLPGTTFGNLAVNLWGADGLDFDTIDKIAQPVGSPKRDLLHDEIMPAFQLAEEDMVIPLSDAEGPQSINSMLYGQRMMIKGLVVNADGSINMPVAFYDLGEYESQVQGKYAVFPEGLVSSLMILAHADFHSDEQQRLVIDFIFENMMDETGQFYGVYDIKQGKMVATDRKVATLPILSSLLSNRDVLSNDEIDFIANSIIANDLVRVGDKLYFAPNGISEDGIMNLNLSDFSISDELFGLLTEYSQNGSRLDEEFGCAMLLEGFANSLKLVLEGQEQNATRLPSSELSVLFSSDGKSYELQPSDTFNINNSFYSMVLMSYKEFNNMIRGFKLVTNQKSFDSLIGGLRGVKDGVYNENQEQIIRESEAMYAELYNAYTIANTYYESWLNVYYFLKMQPSDTVYAHAYNVHTGNMIEAPTEALYPNFRMLSPFIKRFGTPATTMNYFYLVSIFNDKTMVKESAHLVIVNFDMYMSRMFGSQSFDYTNPDLYADNGFNIWSYDSLRHTITDGMPATRQTRYLFATSGTNMAREDWREYIMRKYNEFIPNDEHAISIEDEFPTFYDHLPETEIAD